MPHWPGRPITVKGQGLAGCPYPAGNTGQAHAPPLGNPPKQRLGVGGVFGEHLPARGNGAVVVLLPFSDPATAKTYVQRAQLGRRFRT